MGSTDYFEASLFDHWAPGVWDSKNEDVREPLFKTIHIGSPPNVAAVAGHSPGGGAPPAAATDPRDGGGSPPAAAAAHPCENANVPCQAGATAALP